MNLPIQPQNKSEPFTQYFPKYLPVRALLSVSEAKVTENQTLTGSTPPLPREKTRPRRDSVVMDKINGYIIKSPTSPDD